MTFKVWIILIIIQGHNDEHRPSVCACAFRTIVQAIQSFLCSRYVTDMGGFVLYILLH